jgi:hypothetical protein
MQSGQLSVKNMVSGEQGAMTIDQLIARFWQAYTDYDKWAKRTISLPIFLSSLAYMDSNSKFELWSGVGGIIREDIIN